MQTGKIIHFAAGKEPVDLLLRNARIVNVFNGRIMPGNIAVKDGWIVGIGDYAALESRDLKGRYVAPGLIDAHVHIESAMVGVPEFSRTVAACGTAAVVADPHEIANVLGTAGISYMLRSAENQPLNVYLALPSCVPASSMETSGAELTDRELAIFMSHPRVIALGEMMNFPGVIHGDEGIIRKLDLARQHRLRLEGHAPGQSGKALNAYIAAGITSDHECTSLDEAEEKLAAGMFVMIREGTAARNMEALFPLITPETAGRLMWCTDDRHPHDLLASGHMDAVLRKAIHIGVDPVAAIQMATIHPANYFGLHHMGAVAPGRKADLIVFPDLDCPVIEEVYFNGRQTAVNGSLLPTVTRTQTEPLPASIMVDLRNVDLHIPCTSNRIHVIGLVKDQIVTRHSIETVAMDGDGYAVSDIADDILKIAVIERHGKNGGIGLGFVKGFGLKSGAIASSVAHDSHNIIVVGVNDPDMKAAVAAIVQMGGGMAVVNNGRVLADVELSIAGLMSAQPIETVRDQMDAVLSATRSLGSRVEDPFMALSFLALPVIPELKITDKGLVDVNTFKIIPLFD